MNSQMSIGMGIQNKLDVETVRWLASEKTGRAYRVATDFLIDTITGFIASAEAISCEDFCERTGDVLASQLRARPTANVRRARRRTTGAIRALVTVGYNSQTLR
ncbi:hypothetical protein [Paraburkholderia flagellata]|uniref:hypothetical protein n=1 Tax=Paraburkholderia flagellata TaxID=2883241 RepID=UPI001F2B680C|nr:hypothetical protein [Paraburkholderia flagellata]